MSTNIGSTPTSSPLQLYVSPGNGVRRCKDGKRSSPPRETTSVGMASTPAMDTSPRRRRNNDSIRPAAGPLTEKLFIASKKVSKASKGLSKTNRKDKIAVCEKNEEAEEDRWMDLRLSVTLCRENVFLLPSSASDAFIHIHSIRINVLTKIIIGNPSASA